MGKQGEIRRYDKLKKLEEIIDEPVIRAWHWRENQVVYAETDTGSFFMADLVVERALLLEDLTLKTIAEAHETRKSWNP